MKKKFCLYLTNSAGFYQNHFEPCCWITKKGNLDDPTQFEEYRKWLSEIDDWVPECNYCHAQEARGVISPRQRANDDPIWVGVEHESQIGEITRLHLQIDSDCNAACLICGEYNSSTWKKYNIGSIDDKSLSNKFIDLTNRARTNSRLQTVLKNIKLDKLTHVAFMGGEPFKNDLHKTFLQEIEKTKSLDTVVATYITNGSFLPDEETLNLWSRLQLVHISYSIDGIGPHFDYLRWPLKWHQVEKNIKHIIDLNIPNIEIGISSAINPFNIFYYDRYLEWEKNFFKDFPRYGNFTFKHAFETKGVVNLSCIPEKLSSAIFTKYNDTHPWLVNQMLPFDQSKYNDFIEYIKLHDNKRNLNWSEVFSEIVEYFPELKSS